MHKRILVSGKHLRLSDDKATSFEVLIPGRYVIVSDGALSQGLLDEIPLGGATFLTKGLHTFRPATKPGKLTLLWASAYENRLLPIEWSEVK